MLWDKTPSLLAAMCAAILLAACGGDGQADTDTYVPTPSEDERGAALADLTKTEEFKAAASRYTACLESAGFGWLENGDVPLRDGTFIRKDQASIKITAAVAEYYLERDRCEDESGMLALRRARGVENRYADSSKVDSLNQGILATADCLKARGWQFREPKVLHGVMILDPVLDAAEQDAFDLDRQACGVITP